MEEAECLGCRYFENQGESGECHRHSPSVIYDTAAELVESYWPQVDRDDWCGEWERELC